jgi:hypothetical protein
MIGFAQFPPVVGSSQKTQPQNQRQRRKKKADFVSLGILPDSMILGFVETENAAGRSLHTCNKICCNFDAFSALQYLL